MEDGLEAVEVILDNILVHGQTEAEHDEGGFDEM